jgi:hypothetical protein
LGASYEFLGGPTVGLAYQQRHEFGEVLFLGSERMVSGEK